MPHNRPYQTAGPPPLYELEHGPAVGRVPVFADINGELPRFITVAEHRTDGHQLEHIYKQVAPLPLPVMRWRSPHYRFVRTIDNNHPRYTCPRCGMTSYNANDIEHGYCGACHDWTRIRRYAVVQAGDGVALPAGWSGRWFDWEGVPTLGKAHNLNCHPTGTYVRGAAGAYAEVFEAHPTPIAGSITDG